SNINPSAPAPATLPVVRLYGSPSSPATSYFEAESSVMEIGGGFVGGYGDSGESSVTEQSGNGGKKKMTLISSKISSDDDFSSITCH
ncbi:hypothetical protein Tco_0041985, partial [Tanacetum coccineum]